VVQKNLAALIKRGLRWVTLERDDTARLLALESFLASAKSKDLEDSRGQSIDEARVHAWITRALAVEGWPIAAAVAGTTSTSDDPPITEPRTARPKGGQDTAATIRACLAHLGVASLERLVREVARIEPTASGSEVVGALEAMAGDIRWFGRAIVGMGGSR
jgi:hypothetical protein